MGVNRNERFIPRKSFPTLSPGYIRNLLEKNGLDDQTVSGITSAFTAIFNKFAADERLNYDVIEKYMNDSFVPLLPWGYAGDTSPKNGWHSIHVDEESVAAETGPLLHFGLAPLEGTAVGFGGSVDGSFSTDYWELYSHDGGFTFGSIVNVAAGGGDTLSAFLTIQESGELVDWTLTGPDNIAIQSAIGPSQAFLSMFTETGNSAFMTVQDDGDTFLSLSKGGTGVSYLQMNESSSDPTAPSINNVKVFTRDNGAGKTQLCARFNTGAVQVIATQP